MFQFYPYSLVMLGSGIISLVLAAVVWHRRPAPGITPYVLMMVATALWSLPNVAKLSVTVLQWKIGFTALVYVGVVMVPASWLAFALEYTGRDKYLSRGMVALLCIEPAAVMLLIATYPHHYLFWGSLRLVQDGAYVFMAGGFGPLFWVHTAYSYVLILAGTLVLIHGMIRAPYLYRGQLVGLLLGLAAPWVANLLYIFDVSPLPTAIDLTPLAFTITGVVLGWTLFRYRLMSVVPVAKDVVINTMQDALIVTDYQEQIVDANPAAQALLSPDGMPLVGCKVEEVFKVYPLLLALAGSGGTINLALEGEVRTYSIHSSVITNNRGLMTGRVLSLHDITEIKRTNTQLDEARREAEAANQLKSEFLANMSHELRTPLNAIVGYVQLQLTGVVPDLPAQAIEYNERIFANAQDLLALINDVLDVSKIEAGQLDLMSYEFSLCALLDDIKNQYGVLAAEKDLAFHVETVNVDDCKVTGDEIRVKQVLSNLVSNAIKFTTQGSVTVRMTRVDSETWRFEVEDTGIGIPPHMHSVIFDEFRQVDGSTTRTHGGTGLGLAIVRRLVRMMDGTIRLESRVDEGSTFTVTLKLAEYNR